MAPPPSYGLSAASLCARHFGYTLTESSTVTISVAEEVFTDCAARVTAFLRGRGVDVDSPELSASGALSEGFYLARDLVHDRFSERLVMLATSTETQIKSAKYYQQRAESTEEQLRLWAQDLGNGRPSSADGVGRMGSTFDRMTRRSNFRQAQADRFGRLIDKNRPRRPGS